MARIRVLIVEDSPVVQRLLEHVINADSRLEVVGMAGDSDQALALIQRLRPDVVTMDIRLPRVDGFQVTRRIMQDHPVPIVVVASNVDDKSLGITMNALRAGALTVVEKPGGLTPQDYDAVSRHLCTQLVIMSQVPVVRQIRRERDSCTLPPPLPPIQLDGGRFELVAVVASTGGPGALARVLGCLDAEFPLPVAVVQHMGAAFMAGFTHWLDSVSPLPVALAEPGVEPMPGRVHVAPGDRHLLLRRKRFIFDDSPPVAGQRPSGDLLFRSVAGEYGADAVGVLLTGMGQDGALGLLEMRRAGAHTIAESRDSAVIWGMPGTAVALGAAVEQLAADSIGIRLAALAAQRKAAS